MVKWLWGGWRWFPFCPGELSRFRLTDRHQFSALNYLPFHGSVGACDRQGEGTEERLGWRHSAAAAAGWGGRSPGDAAAGALPSTGGERAFSWDPGGEEPLPCPEPWAEPAPSGEVLSAGSFPG